MPVIAPKKLPNLVLRSVLSLFSPVSSAAAGGHTDESLNRNNSVDL